MGFENPICMDDFEELYEQMVDLSLLNEIEHVVMDLDLNVLIGIEKTMPVAAILYMELEDYQKMVLTPWNAHLLLFDDLGNNNQSLVDLVAKITTELRKSYRFNTRAFKREVLKLVNEECSDYLCKKRNAQKRHLVLFEAIATCTDCDFGDSTRTLNVVTPAKAFLKLTDTTKKINSMIDALKNHWAIGGNPSLQTLEMENELINMIEIHTDAYHEINYYSQIKNAAPAPE